MVTVTEMVKKLVTGSPLLEEGLARSIINLSALARQLQPEIETALMKPVSESAILMALKRFSTRLEILEMRQRTAMDNAGNLTVRSDLCEFTFMKSETLLDSQKDLILALENRRDNFVTFTQGVHEVTVIINADLGNLVAKFFQGERMLSRIMNLSAITINLHPQSVNTPGVHYAILKQLAWKNINVVEVVSTFTEFTIILAREDVDRTFSLLMHRFSS